VIDIFLLLGKKLVVGLVCTTLLLQACSTTPNAVSGDEREEQRKAFIRTHASLEIERVDDLAVSITMFTKEKKPVVTLHAHEKKETWLPGGEQTLLLAETPESLLKGQYYTVNFTLKPGAHHRVRIGVERKFGKREVRAGPVTYEGEHAAGDDGFQLIGLSDVLGAIGKIGASLSLVLFAVATGSAGSIAIPPLEFFRGDDEEKDNKAF